MDDIWLVAGVGAALGMIVGVVVVRYFFTPGNGGMNSKKEIAELNRKLEEQQQQVNEHFVTTADLVNKLTLTYKEVYDHLSQGAQSLCDVDAATQVLEARQNVSKLIAIDDARDISPEPTGPAKDYAPKKPDQAGMLSENFGLHNGNLDK